MSENLVDIRKTMEQLLQKLCQGYNNKIFAPILEADVVAYMYYLWVSRFDRASDAHLDTRICAEPHRKFDFVVGELSYLGLRPCIEKPKLVIEVKAFPFRLTAAQHRLRYYHVIEDDLPKLKDLEKPINSRYMLLFDEDDYLKGFDAQMSRLERITQVRDELDPKIVIVHMKRMEKHLEWKFV